MDKTNPNNIGALGNVQVAAAKIKIGAVAAASSGLVDVIALPIGCLIHKTIVEVEEAFDCGTPVLSIGYNASADNLIPSASVTAGTIGFYENGTPVIARMGTAATVKAKLGRTGAVGSAGVARAMVFFSRIDTE